MGSTGHRGTAEIVAILLTVGIVAALAMILWPLMKSFLTAVLQDIVNGVNTWLSNAGL